MKMHHLLMIGAAVVLIALTASGAVGTPLATLLVIGLLLLCPLMMLGMMGSHEQGGQGAGARQGSEHAAGGSERRQLPR